MVPIPIFACPASDPTTCPSSSAPIVGARSATARNTCSGAVRLWKSPEGTQEIETKYRCSGVTVELRLAGGVVAVTSPRAKNRAVTSA